MFYITLRLDTIEYAGLEALDMRRRLGLPDGNQLRFQGERSPRVEVGEGFARAYFQRSTIVSEQEIPVELLAKGDLRMYGDTYPNDLVWNEAIAPERVRELFLAVRILE